MECNAVKKVERNAVKKKTQGADGAVCGDSLAAEWFHVAVSGTAVIPSYWGREIR